jgi:glucose-1-phosphate cytidylyltransferase
MKVAILCGGKGMRLNGGTTPKALAEVKDRPLVEHVMSIYGDHDFTLLLGHLGDAIRLHFLLHPHEQVHLLDTGRGAQTGNRLRQWMRTGLYLPKATFAVAYCDCLADINVWDVVKFHQSHGKISTLVAVHPTSRFGILGMGLNPFVASFNEKPRTSDWVNAGFFVFSSRVFEYLDDGPLEGAPLEKLAADDQLCAYKHESFFRCVDTQKDLEELELMEGTPWLK